MQQVSAELESVVLNGLYPESGERIEDWIDVVEIYEPTYIPDDDGFDPADAIERFAPVEGAYYVPPMDGDSFIVQGEGVAAPIGSFAYRCELEERDDVEKHMGKEFNSCSITLSNVSRYVANMIQTYPRNLEGYRVVVRTISQQFRKGGIVLFTGRIDKPGEVDELKGSFSSRHDLGGIEKEAPPRIYTTDDPEGRPRTDPLYEGFAFMPIAGTFQYQTVETRRFLFFFKKKKTVTHTEQWSSFAGTPIGDPIPIVGGIAQLAGTAIEFADIGTVVKANLAFCDGRISAITNLQTRTPGFSQPINTTIHLGDLGGVGTNALPDPQFPNSPVYSRLAFVGTSFHGSAPDIIDESPELTGVIRGMLVPLPDGAGGFTGYGWTNNPAYLWRHFTTDPSLADYPPAMVDSEACTETGGICDGVLADDSQGERLFLPDYVAPDIDSGAVRRFRSGGLYGAAFYRFYELLDAFDLPEFAPPDYEFFNPANPPDPALIVPVRYLRKRYTANFALTSKVKIMDFLYTTLLPSFRGFVVVGANGKLKLKTERAADNAFIRGNQAAGISLLPVDDVEKWVTDKKGYALIGHQLITSEYRKIVGTTYSVAGNAITLEADTGSVDAATSGATFAGGTAEVAASAWFDTTASVLIPGGQLVVTIDGTPVAQTVAFDDDTRTLAALMRDQINANPTVSRYVRAAWDAATPNRVFLYSKMGFLEVDAPLENGHASAEEVIRIQAVFDASSIVPKSCKWPLGQSSNSVNQVVITYHEAKDDYKEVRLIVNDYEHQAQVGKTNKIEIDGGCIDNFNQAKRIANAYLSKYREGNWRASLTTDSRAILLEEGDLIAISDDSGGLINVVVRVELLKIAKDHKTTITGRLYSTIMFSDDVGQHDIHLASSLRYIATAPPVASNLVLTELGNFAPDGTWVIRLQVTFDFGAFLGDQMAKVFYKRDGEQYVEWTTLSPDSNGQGRTIIGNLAAGTYWVKVQTEGPFGQTLAVGHPEQSRTLTGRTTIPPDVTGMAVNVVGGRIRFTWNGLDWATYPDFLRFDVYDGTDTKIGETSATEWMENLPATAGAVTRKVKAVLAGERHSVGFAFATFNSAAPATPPTFGGTILGTTIFWEWDNPADPYRDFAYFQIYTDAGLTTLLQGAGHLDGNIFPERIGNPGTYTRYLVAVNSQGLKSPARSAFVTYSSVPDITGLSVTYDGLTAFLTWTEVADPTGRLLGYEIYDASNNRMGFAQKPPFRFIPTTPTTVFKVRAVDIGFHYSPTYVSTTLSIPAPDAPVGLAGVFDGRNITWTLTPSPSNDVVEYIYKNEFGVQKARNSNRVWAEIADYAATSVTRRAYAVGRTGQISAGYAEQVVAIPRPDQVPAASLSAAWDGKLIRWTWAASPSPFVDQYDVTDGTGALVFSEVGLTRLERPVYGTASYTRRVYAVRNGLRSTNYVEYTFAVPAPADPAGYALDFNGRNLVHRWNALQDLQYDISTTGAAGGNIAHLTGGQYFEATPGARASTRWIRAINENGIASNYVSATLTIPTPPAPVLSKTTATSFLDGVLYTITPGVTMTREDWIVRTIVETASDSLFTTIIQTQVFAGVHKSVFVGGDVTANPTVYTRARYEDVFGAGSNSLAQSYTFQKFSDGFFDPNSNLVRLESSRMPLMAGGGVIAFSAGGVLSWDAPFLIAPVSVAIQPSGVITIAAASATLSVGQVLVARQTIGSSSAPTLIVANAASYSAPPVTGTTFDIPLAQYISAGKLKLYSGHVLALGQSVRAGTFIADLSIIDAMIATATITSAKIASLEAAKITATGIEAYIIFGNKIGSSNFVAAGSQTPQTEAIEWTNLENTTVQADLTLKKTGGVAATWDAAATSTRAIHYGAGYAELTILDIASIRMFGLAWGNTPGGTTYSDIDFAWQIKADATADIWELGVGPKASSACAVGDVFRVETSAAGVVTYKRKPFGSSSYTTVYTSAATARYPLLVDTAIYTANGILPRPSINGVLEDVAGAKPHWINIANLSYDASDDLSKTGGSAVANTWDAGASTFEMIPANTDGGIQTTMAADAGQLPRMIGLSTSDPDVNYTTIGWAVQLGVASAGLDKAIYVLESGVSRGNVGGVYATGDIIGIRRVNGNTIQYTKNGVVFYTSTITSTAALYGDTSFGAQTATLKSVLMFSAGAIAQGWQATPDGIIQIGKGAIIAGKDFYAKQVDLIAAIGDQKRYRGNDSFTFLLHKLAGAYVHAWMDLGDDTDRVRVQIGSSFPGFMTDTYANGDSIMLCACRVLNQFGEEIATFKPFPARGDGICADGVHSRRYADPDSQAIYALKFFNYYGWTIGEVYLQAGAIYLTQPTAVRRSEAPLELNVSGLEPGTAIQGHARLSWTLYATDTGSGSYDVKDRRPGETVWRQLGNVSTTNFTFILDHIHPHGDLFEFKIVRVGGSGASSNIVRARMPVQNQEYSSPPATGIVATFNQGTGVVTIKFEVASPNGTAHNVYRYLIGSGAGPTLIGNAGANVGGGSMTLADATAVRGNRYLYTVVQTHSTGIVARAGKSCMIDIPPTASAADPTNFRATSQGRTSVTWEWLLNSAIGAVSFDYKEDIGDGNYTSGFTTVALAAGTVKYVQPLASDKKWIARVRVADAGTSASNIGKATTVVPKGYESLAIY